MAFDDLPEPPATVPMNAQGEAYDAICKSIANVYPYGSDAWTWASEEGGRRRIDPPPADFREWMERYNRSDDVSRRFTRRLFTHWQSRDGFRANGMKLYPHQKALLAYTILHICTGRRNDMASILIRAPYGTGKSLVGGILVEEFQNLQCDMLREGEERENIPRGAIMSARKDVLVQNAVGERLHLRRPPYTIERGHAREYYKQLVALFGASFTRVFPKMGKAWFALFEQDGEDEDAPLRLLRDACARCDAGGKDRAMVALLERLVAGEILLLPDVHKAPRVWEAPARAVDREREGFRGDLAYALDPAIGIRATHRHLLPDPRRYTTHPTPEEPALFAVATGNALTRDPDRMRADIREEIVRGLQFLLVDEAGKLNPGQLGDAAAQLSGRMPLIVGLTGQDAGVEGWSVRTPELPVERTVELRLTKPVGFQLIGGGNVRYPAGSEGAWKQYADQLFTPVQAAERLRLKQPWQMNGLVIVPPKLVWEYGHRLAEAYRQKGEAVDIFCYDPQAGQDRLALLRDFLIAPGKGVRKVVGAARELSTGLSIPIGCIDVLADVNAYELHQLLGRLLHQRNLGGAEAERTFFRQQIFASGKTAVLLRRIAEETGMPLPERDAVWVPLHCAFDRSARDADGRRGKLGQPQPVPDVPLPKGSKAQPSHPSRLWNPMAITSPSQQERMRLLEERRAKRNGSAHVPALRTSDVVSPDGILDKDAVHQLAEQRGIAAYAGSLCLDAEDAWRQGSRGAKLWSAVDASIQRLTVLQERRRNGNGSS